MRDEINIRKWISCPKCGNEDVELPVAPPPGQNAYFSCEECGQKGVWPR